MIYLLTAIGLTPGGSSTVRIYTQTLQQYSTHLHTNSTAVQYTFTHKQYTEYTKRNIHNNKKLTNLGSAGRAPSLRVIPWHFPYKWGKSTGKPQLGSSTYNTSRHSTIQEQWAVHRMKTITQGIAVFWRKWAIGIDFYFNATNCKHLLALNVSVTACSVNKRLDYFWHVLCFSVLLSDTLIWFVICSPHSFAGKLQCLFD
jgi:hypothetical protein